MKRTIKLLDKSPKLLKKSLNPKHNMVMVYLSRGVDNKDFGSHWAFYSKRKAWPMEVIRYRHVLEVNPKRLLWKPSRLLFSSHALSHRHSPPASEFLEQTEETTGACHSCLVKMSPASGKDRILQSSIVFYINFYGYTKFSSFCLITVSVRGANLSKFLPSIKPSLWKGGKKKEKKKRLMKEQMIHTKEGAKERTPKERAFLKKNPSQYKNHHCLSESSKRNCSNFNILTTTHLCSTFLSYYTSLTPG